MLSLLPSQTANDTDLLKMDSREALINTLKFKSWALLDIEYVQVSKYHKCIRKLYVLTGDGKCDLEMEFTPCVPYYFLSEKDQRSFRWCTNHIHKLPYYPATMSRPCIASHSIIRIFVNNHNVEVVLYKGGTIERDVCQRLRIESQNIEVYDKLKKVHSHDPGTEVSLYWDQLNKYTHSLF